MLSTSDLECKRHALWQAPEKFVLGSEGFNDGATFHWVIPGRMVQGADGLGYRFAVARAGQPLAWRFAVKR